MKIEQLKIARYDQQALNEILKEENDALSRAKALSAAKQWCLKNGVDVELMSYSHLSRDGSYYVDFRTFSYDPGVGRLKDAEVADLQRRLKKAPFKYEIQGIKEAKS